MAAGMIKGNPDRGRQRLFNVPYLLFLLERFLFILFETELRCGTLGGMIMMSPAFFLFP